MKNFFTSYKDPVTVLLALILAAGIFTYSHIQTTLFPEVTFPRVKIIADNGEQPVEKMMVTVTTPLETAIKRVPGLSVIRSTTSRGSCEITALLDWNADITSTQQQIESLINQARNSLPPELEIRVEKMNPSILPVMSYTLEGNKSPVELTLIAKYIIKPFLSQVNGVSGIPVVGGKTKEYWLIPDPQKMSAFGIAPKDIAEVINENNNLNSTGYLRDYRRLYLTVTDFSLKNKNEIENIVVRNTGKRAIRIKDIASVEVHELIEYTKINANGKAAVLVGILKQPGANLINLSLEMEEKVKQLNKILPKGVVLEPYYVQADFVNDSIRSVSDSLLIGLGLAIIVAIIFLRSFKASTTILITIPITLSLTLLVLYSIGYTFNIMTLGAIAAAIGLIIDDAIVVVEQIHRTHEEHPEENSRTLVGKAIHFLFPSMVGSSVSTIVIFIPFVFLSGVAGAYFKVLTNTMIITLVCSFIVTWLGLPVVYLLLSKHKRKTNVKVHEAHTVKKQAWISSFIHKPWIALLFIIALIVSVFIIYPLLETGFLPEMDEGTIVLDYTSPPGTSLEETNRMLSQADKFISANPDVKNYSRRTGTEMGFFITEQNSGDYLIQLKKDRTKSTQEVIDEIREDIERTQPALQIDFGQVIGDMLGDLISTPQPIEVKIFGDDPVKLNEIAEQVGGIVEKVEGTADVFNGIVIMGPTVELHPDIPRLSQYGITPADFQMQVQTQMEGTLLSRVQEKEHLTNIRMIYKKSDNYGINSLEKNQLFLPGGKLKPLSEFADVRIISGVAEIQRENLQSMVPVTARLDNRDLGSTIKEIKEKIAGQVHLPPGFHIDYGGAFAEQQKSFSELLIILITAFILVFAVILFLFRSLKAASLILLIAVLGISGSFIALFITGTPLNVGSYTGTIMIVGIIGENAIFTFQQFFQQLQTSNAEEAIIYSISTRLRPKLMTALGAIIALMPIALGIGAGAQLHQPLAIAVIGGFIIALPLLLVVLPSLLKIAYSKSAQDN